MIGIDGNQIEILMVEDSPGDARLATEALREGRVQNGVAVVTDGVEALAYLRRQGRYANAPRPDLVLLDLNLPRKSCQEVLAEVKQDPALRSIPIVILTTSRDDPDELRVLVIEDNPGDRRLILEALAASASPRFRVQSADRLAAALEAIDRGEIDIILTDLTLPDSSGLQTLRAIQRRAPQLPVVALTGVDDDDVELAAVEAGADDYLRKSTAGTEPLLRSIRHAIQRRARIARKSAPGVVYAVAGPKRGVGKTLVAMNLAGLLAGDPREILPIGERLDLLPAPPAPELGDLLTARHGT